MISSSSRPPGIQPDGLKWPLIRCLRLDVGHSRQHRHPTTQALKQSSASLGGSHRSQYGSKPPNPTQLLKLLLETQKQITATLHSHEQRSTALPEPPPTAEQRAGSVPFCRVARIPAAAAACRPVGEGARHGTDRCCRYVSRKKSECGGAQRDTSGALTTFSLKREPKDGKDRGVERRRRHSSDIYCPRCPYWPQPARQHGQYTKKTVNNLKKTKGPDT